MQPTLHAAPGHIGLWLFLLVAAGLLATLVLGIASLRQSLRMHLVSKWPLNGQSGSVFQGPTEWQDINEAADRSAEAVRREGDR